MAELYQFSWDDERIDSDFERAATNLINLHYPLGQVGDYLREVVFEAFLTEGESNPSGRWLELSPKYEKAKFARFGPMPILQATQDMFKAMVAKDSYTIEGDTVVYEPDTSSENHPDIAAIHQEGSGRVPARPILELTDEDELHMEDIFHEWLSGILTRDLKLTPATQPRRPAGPRGGQFIALDDLLP